MRMGVWKWGIGEKKRERGVEEGRANASEITVHFKDTVNVVA